MKRMMSIVIVALFLLSVVSLVFAATPASGASYGSVNLSGGFQSGHFNDVYDLTAGDITLSFTYDATGMVDDPGAHAWAELGVKSVGTADDFNPYSSISIYQKKTVDLMAGKNIDVGSVTIQRIGNTIYVDFIVEASGWYMTETHLAIANSLTGIPQAKGNPIPGQFPYSMDHDPPVTSYEYAVPTSALPTAKLYVAAHAALIHLTQTCIEIVSDGDTVWSADGSTNWQPAVPCFVHSVWNHDLEALGATWIWRTALTDVLDEYNTVPDGGWYFERGFTLPTNAQDITTSVTAAAADNAYRIAINGVPLVPDGYGVMDKVGPAVMDTFANVHNHVVPDNTVIAGANALQLRALNCFDYGDGYSNPAGLIYKMTVCYNVIDAWETGWAAGCGFTGKNWATYFTYTPGTATVVSGSGIWLVTEYDGTANTFDPDPVGDPNMDIDDMLLLQKVGGNGLAAYDLPQAAAQPEKNYGFWFDRDGVDQWQANMWGSFDGQTYNTAGLYDVVITLHATGATTGTAFMTVNGVPQGFYDGPWFDGQPPLYPVGQTFVGDMQHLVVFYGLFGYGATHTAVFSDIVVTQ